MVKQSCKICKWYELKEKTEQVKTKYCTKWKKELEAIYPCRFWEMHPKIIERAKKK